MRELPEVEVLRRELEREMAGRTVKTAALHAPTASAHVRTKKAFTDQLEGGRVESVRRKGLLLVITVSHKGGRSVALVVRLGDSGSFRRGADAPGAALSIAFTQGPGLHLVDLGPDGELRAVPADELDLALPELATYGFDPLDEPLTWVRFAERLMARHEPLRRALLDPTFVAGLGDVYVDEALFEAGVRHDRRCDSLSTQEVRRLYRSLIEVLHDAVKHRGCHLGEHGICDLTGKPGDHQEHLQVHGRDGKRSPRSRTPIRKARFEGHTVYFCDTQV